MVSQELSDDWIELTTDPLEPDAVLRWVGRPGCGAQVLFSGTVRDHADGRPGVTQLEYEAYEGAARARLVAIVDEARRRWSDLGRVAVIHRLGRLGVGESSVLVVVSTPHRATAFESALWCIDTVKSTVPIWKRETWEGGVGWGTDASDIETIDRGGRVPS